MSKSTFIPFCIEHYAEHVKQPGYKVYNLFKEEKLLDEFYNSVTAECYADDDLGLYGQSALHIFGLFVEEKLSSNR